MLDKKYMIVLSKQLKFWEHLTSQQKEFLSANTRSITFQKGQDLHCSKCDCMGVLVILSGSIRVYITSEEGREVTLYRLGAGDVCILSASCVLQAITFDVSLSAESECNILQIQSHAFARLSSENIYVELFSYQLTTERFSEVMWAMQQILFTRFDKRLAAFLLDESLAADGDSIYMTHEQIAKYLGTAREVVSRMLKYFAEEGYVSLSRGDITIIDKKRLRALV